MPSLILSFADFIKIYNDAIADGYEMVIPGNCMCGPMVCEIKVTSDYEQGTIINFSSEVQEFYIIECDDEHSIKLQKDLETIYIEREHVKFNFIKTLVKKLV